MSSDNEFTIRLPRQQYDHDREYWQELSWRRARAINQGVVIVVDDDVIYRAWPQRESAYKGIEEQS